MALNGSVTGQINHVIVKGVYVPVLISQRVCNDGAVVCCLILRPHHCYWLLVKLDMTAKICTSRLS